jgi:hypothetical protein
MVIEIVPAFKPTPRLIKKAFPSFTKNLMARPK